MQNVCVCLHESASLGMCVGVHMRVGVSARMGVHVRVRAGDRVLVRVVRARWRPFVSVRTQFPARPYVLRGQRESDMAGVRSSWGDER